MIHHANPGSSILPSQLPPYKTTFPDACATDAHISLEVYKRPLLSITDYNVFHTGRFPGTEGIRKGSLLDLWDLYGHKRDKTLKDRD